MQVELKSIAEWVGGEITGKCELTITGVSTDTRTILAGDIFVALKGDNFDGNKFVKQAFTNGAAAAIVSDRDALGDNPGIVVADTLRALGDFAMIYRWQEPLIPWVGVTGSNGKSTTRHLIAHILRTHGQVLEPIKNYNNLVGLPLTILGNTPENKFGVLEMGTSMQGEIARLAEIAKPTAAVITNIAPAHLEGLGSIAGVASEKMAAFSQLPGDGLAVLPAESRFSEMLKSGVRSTAQIRTFGIETAADYMANNIDFSWSGSEFSVRGVRFKLPLLGKHNVMNCLAALAVVEFMGVSLEEASEAVTSFMPLQDRQLVIETERYKIISDCYNANPESLRAGVNTLEKLDSGRKVLIIGDMLELGHDSARIHFELGRWLSGTNVDVILAVGKMCMSLAEGAHAQNARQIIKHFRGTMSLLGHLKELLQDGDTILVKGSNAMRLNRVVSALKIM